MSSLGTKCIFVIVVCVNVISCFVVCLVLWSWSEKGSEGARRGAMWYRSMCVCGQMHDDADAKRRVK